MPDVDLVCHPETHGGAVRSIRARIARTADGILTVCYFLAGDLARLRIPPARESRVAERLWEHTCCEIFVAREGTPAYHELNLAPSGEWAAYAFVRYRDGRILAEEALNPRIAVRRTPEGLDLNATVGLGHLSPAYLGARLSLGLSAVIEDDSGSLSYWALRHPAGRPDFHHPESFALTLE